jgi:hypothetical protein
MGFRKEFDLRATAALVHSVAANAQISGAAKWRALGSLHNA